MFSIVVATHNESIPKCVESCFLLLLCFGGQYTVDVFISTVTPTRAIVACVLSLL